MEQSPVTLSPHDLIELEPLLCAALARFFSFSSHGLYFPRDDAPEAPLWLPRERKLLLPLRAPDPSGPGGTDGRRLGVFMAGGVGSRGMRALLPALPGIAALCLENLALHKRAGLDGETGLLRRDLLVTRMVRELEHSREEISGNGEDWPAAGLPPQRGSMGLVVLRLADAAHQAERAGHAFVAALRRNLAQEIAAHNPYKTPAFRCGEDEFALLLHEPAARTACERACAALARGLASFTVEQPPAGRKIRPLLSLGYAVYPQDMEGEYFLNDFTEQAERLLARARLAALTAEEGGRAAPGRIRALGFARIVQEGGRVRRVLPLARLLVNLGRASGAHPGLRFSLLPPEGESPKGEVELLEVDEEGALARLLHPEHPDDVPAEGDRLILLPDGLDAAPAEAGENIAGLLSPGAFRECAAAVPSPCCLILVRLDENDEDAARTDELLARLAACCLKHARPDFAARSNSRSLVLFHAGGDARALAAAYAKALRAAKKNGIRAAVGLAGHPYLHFTREELMDCCVKALHLAELLPEPKMGVFGSLALNISADRHYSRGELFRAVQEYEWALLADKNNADAWNSLGFCMAALSRLNEAQRYFAEALKRRPDDAVTLYNLGMVCRALGKKRAAGRWFKACLAKRPDHAFAHIRLGQLAVESGRLPEAERRFTQGMNDPAAAGPAKRLAARLALRRNRTQDARAHLHEALLINPRDAQALCMLAQLYLDCGEDPAVAEMLARQSAALMPELVPARRALASALALQGREPESSRARPAG